MGHLSNCFQTEGDTTFTVPWLCEPMSGRHRDLFDVFGMIAANVTIKGPNHSGKIIFWEAR